MYNEQTFIVTGSASGIGQFITQNLVYRGHKVVATDIQETRLKEIALQYHWSSDQVLIRKLDVRDSESWTNLVQECVKQFGRIDCLLNIAGFLHPSWIHETLASDVHSQIDINTKGVIFGTIAAVQEMKKQKSGHIVNISSLAGCAPVPGMSLYSASKYAVRGFSLAVACELRSHGIAVTTLCPDGVLTPMMTSEAHHDEAALVFSGSKILTVEDIAKTLFEKVLPHKPLEVFIPSSRGYLARVADLFPSLFFRIEPYFRKRGMRRLSEFRKAHPSLLQ